MAYCWVLELEGWLISNTSSKIDSSKKLTCLNHKSLGVIVYLPLGKLYPLKNAGLGRDTKGNIRWYTRHLRTKSWLNIWNLKLMHGAWTKLNLQITRMKTFLPLGIAIFMRLRIVWLDGKMKNYRLLSVWLLDWIAGYTDKIILKSYTQLYILIVHQHDILPYIHYHTWTCRQKTTKIIFLFPLNLYP